MKENDWREEFTEEELTAGKDLFQRGLVTPDHLWMNSTVFRVLEDNQVFEVTAHLRTFSGEWVLECECFEHCIHKAAVYWYLEAHDLIQPAFEEPEDAVSVQETEISGSYKDPYAYYDMERIMENSLFTTEEIEKGKTFLKKKTVVLNQAKRVFLSEKSDAKEGFYLEGTIKDAYFDLDKVWLSFSGNRIVRGRCELCEMNGYGPSCGHMYALLKQVEPHLRDQTFGDATSKNASLMMRNYLDHASFDPDAKPHSLPFHLEPRLIYGDGKLSLGFRGGKEKRYVIKNMYDLISAWKNHTEYTDRHQEADFSVTKLSEADDELFQMAVRFAEDQEYLKNVRQETISFDTVPLSGSRLDQFFEMNLGKTFPIRFRAGIIDRSDAVTLRDGTMRPKITLEPVLDRKNRLEGISMKLNALNTVMGNAYTYILHGNQFLRLDRGFTEAISPLLQVMSEPRYETFVIGRRRLARFYHGILPKLRQYCDIIDNTEGKIEAYIPPALEAKFYLDCNDRKVFLSVSAVYGDDTYPFKEKTGSGLSWRDEPAENRMLEIIHSCFPESEYEGTVFYAEREDDNVFRILSEGVAKLAANGEVHFTDRFRNLRLRRRPNFRFGVSVENSLLDLELLSEDLSPEELLELLKSYREKKKYHKLRNGEFIGIEDSMELMVLSELLDSMQVSLKEFVKGKIHIPAYRALYLDRMLEEQQAFSVDRRKSYRELVSGISSYRDNAWEVPEYLRPVLRGYQAEGFRWLMTLKDAGFGGVLADDMGLGKTIQMIAVLAAEKEEGNVLHSLIVCPASLVYNWAEEFRKFAPQLTVQIIAGTKKERTKKIRELTYYDVSVTSYDLLKRDIDEYGDITFDYEVLDEAQYIKNPASEAARSTKIIHARHRFALTGTPIENRLSELWSIFDYLMPGFLYGYETFRRELETPITVEKDETAVVRLRRMVSPFILRRLKENVLKDLPEKLEETIYTRFDAKQQKVYDGQLVRVRKDLAKTDEEEFRRTAIRVLAELTKLRQICCDPRLIFENYDGGSAKRDALYQLVETANEGGHRMLVFSQFASMLKIIEADLKERGIPCYRITGDTPAKERLRMVSAFNDNEVPVFLISLKAGGTGLNLTGADIVIHYDPWWNIAAMNQASDRAHRIGQTRTVTVYRIIVKDSIEDRILKMQETKKDLSDSILRGDMGGFARMSREELLELLS